MSTKTPLRSKRTIKSTTSQSTSKADPSSSTMPSGKEDGKTPSKRLNRPKSVLNLVKGAKFDFDAVKIDAGAIQPPSPAVKRNPKGWLDGDNNASASSSSSRAKRSNQEAVGARSGRKLAHSKSALSLLKTPRFDIDSIVPADLSSQATVQPSQASQEVSQGESQDSSGQANITPLEKAGPSRDILDSLCDDLLATYINTPKPTKSRSSRHRKTPSIKSAYNTSSLTDAFPTSISEESLSALSVADGPSIPSVRFVLPVSAAKSPIKSPVKRTPLSEIPLVDEIPAAPSSPTPKSVAECDHLILANNTGAEDDACLVAAKGTLAFRQEGDGSVLDSLNTVQQVRKDDQFEKETTSVPLDLDDISDIDAELEDAANGTTIPVEITATQAGENAEAIEEESPAVCDPVDQLAEANRSRLSDVFDATAGSEDEDATPLASETLDYPLKAAQIQAPAHTPSKSPLKVVRAAEEADSDSNDEWLSQARTPARGKRRIVLDSDDEVTCSPLRSSLRQAPVIDMTREDGSDRDTTRHPRASISSMMCCSDGEEEEGEEDEDSEEEATYDLTRHYDESYGSLRDFIVDDDDEEESGDELEEDEEEGSSDVPRSKSVRRSDKVARLDTELVASDWPEESSDESDAPGPSSKKTLKLPDLGRLSINEAPTSSSTRPKASKSERGVEGSREKLSKKNSGRKWVAERERLARQVFDDLDKRVFEGKLSATTMEWNKRLLTTAGQANSTRTTRPDGTRVEVTKLILSDKVLTGEEQILNTVAHEMCHVACWIISNERKNPHGKVFKSWGRKVMRARPDITVTTKHNYEIEYKYQWKCSTTTCNKIYKRHSKSIDTERQRCGLCKGVLEPLFKTRPQAVPTTA